MSYDLVFASDTELSRADVRAALRTAFGTEIRLEGDTLHGPDFSLAMPERATELHVACGWEIVRSPAGRAHLAALRYAGCDLLGATCTNPQTSVVRAAPRPPDVKASRIVAPLTHTALKLQLDGEHCTAIELTIRDEATANDWHILLAKQLQQPRAAGLRSIKVMTTLLGGGTDADEAAVQAIAEAPHVGALRELWLNAYDTDSSCMLAIGNLNRLLDAAPGLAKLEIAAETVMLRPFEHAALETLSLRWLASTQDIAGAALRSTLPALRVLQLAADTAIEPDLLRTFLARTPHLHALGLRRARATPAIVAAIERGRQGDELLLELDHIDDAAARMLIEQHPRHPKDRLELHAAACSDDLALAIEKTYGTAARVDHPAIAARRRAMASAAKSATYAARAAKNAEAGKLPGPAIGTRVKHATFGAGTVHGRVGADKAQITFDDGSERVLMLRFVTEV